MFQGGKWKAFAKLEMAGGDDRARRVTPILSLTMMALWILPLIEVGRLMVGIFAF